MTGALRVYAMNAYEAWGYSSTRSEPRH